MNLHDPKKIGNIVGKACGEAVLALIRAFIAWLVWGCFSKRFGLPQMSYGEWVMVVVFWESVVCGYITTNICSAIRDKQ